MPIRAVMRLQVQRGLQPGDGPLAAGRVVAVTTRVVRRAPEETPTPPARAPVACRELVERKRAAKQERTPAVAREELTLAEPAVRVVLTLGEPAARMRAVRLEQPERAQAWAARVLSRATLIVRR